MVGFPHRTCDCGRPPGQCVKGDLEDCPALDEEDNDDLMECPSWQEALRLAREQLAAKATKPRH